MCGICGVWYFDADRPVDESLLARMMDQMIHRGPDEAGAHLDGSVGLGFRRLSIIDLAGSQQPMCNEDGRVWIVFNGEIYNFQELRQRLLDRHTFSTVGDTETILHAYEEYGLACVDHMRGMFGFAIWDARENRLTMAVDRFGKKPLYYLLDDEKLLFASELKSILQHPGVSRELDAEALDEYLTNGAITAPRSIFAGIRKLPPGHIMTVSADGQARLTEYWHPHMATPEKWDTRPLDDMAAELRELLLEAVRLRMISDVPLGAFLSGGVDSSAVVALMSHVSTQPVRTFSIGFDETFFDETSYAQAVAEYCRTDHLREVVRPDVVAILPKLIHQYDEPFADSSMIPTYYVSQAARQHVTVSLSGDGGDEVFAGYRQYIYGARQYFLKGLLPTVLRPSAARLARFIPRFAKVGPYLATVDREARVWGMRTSDFFSAAQRRQLYTGEALARLDGYQGEQVRIAAFERALHLDWLSQLQYSDLTVYMPGDILVKVDRASMLASLEVRCPLLDHEVFEFMARVPTRYKIGLRDTKTLLKKAVGDLLPPAIYTRNKMGFHIPLAEWLRGPLQPMLRDVLLSTSARGRGLFETTVVQRLLDEHVSQQQNHKERLWALLCFELWAREYVDTPAAR